MKILLFDANGCFGPMAAAQADYPRAADLLAHMDRLGVSRAVVWHTSVRDHHAATGNRQLLAAIANEERLVPAFGVGVDMLWARDGLRELTAAFASRRVRALRLFAAAMKFDARKIARVIDAVADYHPVVFCDVREVPDPAALAEQYPQLPIVLTHAMWGALPSLLDTLRRHPNVHADLSWIHSNGTLELLCRQFGADRVIFGLGGRAHQGAAIAALVHAEICDDERARIAHGNLDRLLDLPATPPRPATIAQPLWQRFIQREPLGIELLDAHGHLGPQGTWMLERQELAEQIPQALHDMDQCSIQTLVVSGLDAIFGDPVAGNDLLAAALQPHGDRFRGWIVFNPHHADQLTPHLDRWLANPFFAGFKIHNDAWKIPVTDPRLEIVWRTADRYRLPILFHTWDSSFNSPAMFRDICPKYPNAAFIFGHAGGGDRGRREAVAMAAAHPNVWLEWCGSFCSSIPWEETLPQIGKDRLLFGSDAVVHNFAWELGRLLSVDLPAEMIRPALGANLRGLLARRTAPHANRPS